MVKKTTLTLTPRAAQALNEVPAYIRKAEFLRYIDALAAGSYTTVVKQPSEMRYATLALSDKIMTNCIRLREWLDDFKTV